MQREREKQRKRNRKEARAMLLLLKARNHGWRANTFRSVRFRSDERFVSNSSIASLEAVHVVVGKRLERDFRKARK